MRKMWDFGSNGMMREAHPTSQLQVGAGVVREFSSDCLTESGHGVPILGQIFNNGSVQYLGIPEFHRTGGPF